MRRGGSYGPPRPFFPFTFMGMTNKILSLIHTKMYFFVAMRLK